MKFENVGLIIDDNPISRSYINILKKNKVKLKFVIYLLGPYFLSKKIYARVNFNQKNKFALNFLKDVNVIDLTHQIEKFFGFDENFCIEMYNYDNIYNISENLIFISDQDINSRKIIKLLKNIDKTTFFNSGKQILKDILDTKHNFIHIHPGYLPDIRGADGSLWQIKLFNNLGVSTFFMNKGIDTGQVILREIKEIPSLNLNNLQNYSIKDLYRIWFSFFDPLLRGYQFSKLLKKDFKFDKYEKKNFKEGSYYSIMNNEQLKNIFNKIFNFI